MCCLGASAALPMNCQYPLYYDLQGTYECVEKPESLTVLERRLCRIDDSENRAISVCKWRNVETTL